MFPRVLAALVLPVLALSPPGPVPQWTGGGTSAHSLRLSAPLPQAGEQFKLALSLVDALPSPTPVPLLPRMPLAAVGPSYFHEDFEHGLSRWEATGGRGDLGWHHLRAVACGGHYTMVLGRPHNEPFSGPATRAWLTARGPIHLRGAHRPRLQYDLRGVTTPHELLAVRPEIQLPGQPWHPVGAEGVARYTLVATFTADLTPYAGRDVRLRFVGHVGASARPNRGLYLDDVFVLEPRVERPRVTP